MKRRSSAIKRIAATLFSATIIISIVFGLFILFIYRGISFEADERLFESSFGFGATCFYCREDNEWVKIENGGNLKKTYYSINDMSPYITEGIVRVEDKLFYSHRGVDIKRTVLAAINHITRKSRTFGASTITQQVVKNISGDNDFTIRRKIEEIIRAIHLERKYTKEQILEVYLNVLPMSDNIYGVGAASQIYFGKEPSALTPREAATIIGITNAPTAYSPYRNPDKCKNKRNVVLSVMYKDGLIGEEEYLLEAASELSVISRDSWEDRYDSWFVECVIDDVCKDLTQLYGISSSMARIMLLGGGYKVYTTMDREIQGILENYFENSDNFPSEVFNGLNFSMAVTDSNDGRLVGIVGRVGEKSANRLLNHALVPHIPASALKPIALYAPLIDSGLINWSTVIDDLPVSFTKTEDGYIEYPKNSPDVYSGLTTVKDGLSHSKNTIAVKLCQMMGQDKVFKNLKDGFYFDTLIENEKGITDLAIAPMALGQLGRGISLRKLTEAYSVFTGEGERREAISYYFVEDYNGRPIIEREQQRNRIFKPSTAKIMNQMLMCVTNDGTASSIGLKNKIDTAGKTGTASGSLEKMFIGYTPYYTAGIWCGYDKNDQAVKGLAKTHLQIWDEIMTKIHKEADVDYAKGFSTDGLLLCPYCKDSGKLYSDNCLYDPRGSRMEYGYFSEDNTPQGSCDRHIVCLYDFETKAIACKNCPEENLTRVSLIKVTDRAFPKEIVVTDAEFVYRDVEAYTERPIDYSLPYFYYTLPDGVFVGKSKGKKQFNSNCYIHDE